jgi:hypothetical protein
MRGTQRNKKVSGVRACCWRNQLARSDIRVVAVLGHLSRTPPIAAVRPRTNTASRARLLLHWRRFLLVEEFTARHPIGTKVRPDVYLRGAKRSKSRSADRGKIEPAPTAQRVATNRRTHRVRKTPLSGGAPSPYAKPLSRARPRMAPARDVSRTATQHLRQRAPSAGGPKVVPSAVARARAGGLPLNNHDPRLAPASRAPRRSRQ